MPAVRLWLSAKEHIVLTEDGALHFVAILKQQIVRSSAAENVVMSIRNDTLAADVDLDLPKSVALRIVGDLEREIALFQARRLAQGRAIGKSQTIKRDQHGEMEIVETRYQY